MYFRNYRLFRKHALEGKFNNIALFYRYLAQTYIDINEKYWPNILDYVYDNIKIYEKKYESKLNDPFKIKTEINGDCFLITYTYTNSNFITVLTYNCVNSKFEGCTSGAPFNL